MSLSDLRNELRALRKESAEHKPVSRLRKSDVSSQLEALKKMREETPAAAAVPSTKSKKMESSSETIKHAKASEFKTRPAPKKSEEHPKKKGKLSKAALRQMIEELSSDEEL